MAGNPFDATPSRNSAGQALDKVVRGIFCTVAKGFFAQSLPVGRQDAKTQRTALADANLFHADPKRKAPLIFLFFKGLISVIFPF